MTINPNSTMDATADVSLIRSLRGVPLLHDSPPLKFRQNTADSTATIPVRYPLSSHRLNSGNSSEGKNISLAFRNVFSNSSSAKSQSSVSRQRSSVELDRMNDALSRSERLLYSENNVRANSKSKSFIVTSPAEQDQLPTEAKPLPNSAHSMHRQSTMHTTSTTDTKTNGITAPESENLHLNLNSLNENTSNNAVGKQGTSTGPMKKVKKHRKRPKSSVKNRRVKHGRASVPAAGALEEKDGLVSVKAGNEPPEQTSVNLRLITEHVSKMSPYFSHPQHSQGSVKQPSVTDARTNPAGSMKAQLGPGPNASGGAGQSEESQRPLEVQAHSKPLVQQATTIDNERRVMSSTSIRSCHSIGAIQNTDTGSNHLVVSNQFSLTAKKVNLVPQSVSTISAEVHGTAVQQKSSVTVNKEKEKSLTAIYGSNSRLNHSEDVKKLRKIFLSEKQSKTVTDCGMDVPCAPPATPTAEVLRKYEYVPSMNDIRSQQAVKNRLRAMERDAHKRQEKQKETRVKLEKQQLKEKEKMLRAKQRLEIYALNKVMTDLEYKKFRDFCGAKGLNV